MHGVHPRIGALDVLPFVPVGEITLEECARLAVEAGQQIWAQWKVPVFLYEAAARIPERKALEAIRSPAFTGAPDIGEGRHPTAGASVVGARKFLVAWNIWLKSADLALAKHIARAIRQSTGGFPGVKALGLPLASEGLVQVSINSTDWEATPLPVIFAAVEQLAREVGVEIAGKRTDRTDSQEGSRRNGAPALVEYAFRFHFRKPALTQRGITLLNRRAGNAFSDFDRPCLQI